MKTSPKKKIVDPAKQLNLYGYKEYFFSFMNLYDKGNLPNAILLNGEKGIGKSTFAYHFINYLLSKNEKNQYSVENFLINQDNNTYKLIQESIHPNFYLLNKNLSTENIKIDQVRNLLNFLNKTTYTKDIKIVLIDDTSCLNLNSSNALLKALEEPPINTFFILIHNSSSEVIDTIKSRCLNFKIHFNLSEKKKILDQILIDYEIHSDNSEYEKFLFFSSPGNLLRILLILNETDYKFTEDYYSSILFLLNEYKIKKDSDLLQFATLFIETFYNQLSLRNNFNVNEYFINKNKILYLIRDYKKFNLNTNNLIFTIEKILKNEKK